MSKRSSHGKLAKLDRQYKVRRAAKKKRKGTWAARVWARKHIKGQI